MVHRARTERRRLMLGMAAALVSPVNPAGAQPRPAKARRLGVIQPSSPPDSLFEALLQGLRERGYSEGSGLLIDVRWANGRIDVMDALAAALVAARPDVICTLSTPAALAAKRATSTIPIVFTGVGDPVGAGVVTDLAHPTGNVTGISTLAPELAAKRLEMLHEMVPRLSTVAMIWNDLNPSMVLSARRAEVAGSTLGIEIQSLGVHDLNDFDAAFRAIRAGSASAVLVLADPFTRSNRQRIIDFASGARLPAMYEAKEFIEAGGLLSYGPSLTGMQRRAAYYIDKILNGARPAELPVEQPTVFELFINLATARSLGIAIPPSLLERADQVIK
jgi:putative ABC transport system substrate-binding protein